MKAFPYHTYRDDQTCIRIKIREVRRSDSESDHVKSKAAKRTLQSLSLRLLLTEKNQALGFCSQTNPSLPLPRQGPSLGSLCEEYNPDLVTSWQARRDFN